MSYDYDENGNRLSRSSADASLDEVLGYAAASNRLLSRAITRVGLLPVDFIDLTVQEFVYNAANRLFQLIEDGDVTAEYIYNDNGLRTRKTLFNGDGSTSTTIYHYDQIGMLISETTQNGQLIRDYVW